MAKLLSGTRIYGNATVDTNLIVSGTTVSTSTSTGALTVAGGLGVAGSIYAAAVYDNGTRSVSTSTGAGNLTISSGSINLTASGPGAVNVGSATSVPTIVTDVYGRIVSLTSNAVSTTINLAGTSGTGSVAGGGTLTFAGTYGVTATASSSTVTIGTPQDLRTTAATTFAGVQALAIGNVTPGTGAFTTLAASGITQITNSTSSTSTGTGALQVSGGVGITGNVWVGGNLYVANLISTTQSVITIQDPLVYFQAPNSGAEPYNYDIGFYSDYTAPRYEHSGIVRSFASNAWIFFSNIQSEPGASTINWNDTGIAYDTVKAGALTLANSTASTSTSTGALVVTGGAGIGGSAYVGGSATAASFYTGNQGIVAFNDADSSNYVGFKAPATVGVNLVWTLPSSDGSSGQVLSTDGLGTLSWGTGGGGSSTGGYFNSTLTSFPGTSGNIDYGNGETYVGQAATLDAFGISLVSVFSCNDPTGSIQTNDLGSVA